MLTSLLGDKQGLAVPTAGTFLHPEGFKLKGGVQEDRRLGSRGGSSGLHEADMGSGPIQPGGFGVSDYL